MLKTATTSKSLSMSYRPIVLQNIHKDTQKNVEDIVERLRARDGTAARLPRPDLARHFFKLECLALEYDECFNFRILQREALAEDGQGLPVHTHESRSGI